MTAARVPAVAAVLAVLLMAGAVPALAASQWQGHSYPAAEPGTVPSTAVQWRISDTGGTGRKGDLRSNLTDVAFADAQRGWTCGRGGVFSSTDGGLRWRREHPPLGPPRSWCHIEVGSAGQPWFAEHWHAQARARLFKRGADGAWAEVAAGRFRAAHDLVMRKGSIWLLGGDQGSFVSADGGASWSRLHFGKVLASAYRMIVLNDGTALVMGLRSGRPALARSADARSNWRVIDLPERLPESVHRYSLHFRDARRGALGLPDGTALATEDGGAQWRRARVSNGQAITAISVLDDGLIYAAVENKDVDHPGPALFRSVDGGRTWELDLSARLRINAFTTVGDRLWAAGHVPGRVSNDLLMWMAPHE